MSKEYKSKYKSLYKNILSLYANGYTIPDIAESLDIPPQNVYYIVKKYNSRKTAKISNDGNIESDAFVDAAKRLSNKYDNVVNLRPKDAELKVALEEIKILEEELEMYKTVSVKPPQYVITIKEDNKINNESTCIINLSDWHVDEKVDPKSVNNLNIYNPDIVKERVNKLLNSCIKIINIERKGVRIDHCVINILGDMITSYLHEENESGNSMPPIDGIVFARDLLCDFILNLQKSLEFKKVTVVGKPGNHSRLTKEKRTVNLTGLNLETVLHDSIYRIIGKGMGKTLEYIYDPSYHSYINIYGYVFRLHHGDSIKYNAGIGGISVSANRMIARLNRIRDAYYDIIGHHHQYGDYGTFMVNGSLIGINTYALYHGLGGGKPSQSLFLVHPKYGKTVTWPIYV